jgi:hypothetical protein
VGAISSNEALNCLNTHKFDVRNNANGRARCFIGSLQANSASSAAHTADPAMNCAATAFHGEVVQMLLYFWS